MDPFLEGWEWESFHAALSVDLADALIPLVRPNYMVRPQRRVYNEHPQSELGEPVETMLAMSEERIETYLTIRDPQTRKVITVIELVSPSNKRPGDGRRKYLTKRDRILQSRTNLVELDLLRGGRRLPTRTPLPCGDYYAIISRAGRRPRAEVYAWTVRQRLPAIPIPLRPGEPDVVLELQPLFSARYDRGRYRHTLDYSMDLQPPLSDADVGWAEELLKPFRRT